MGRGSANGIYRYDPSDGSWALMDEGVEPLVPPERYAVIYFDNALCPACRSYDESWYPFIERWGGELAARGFGVYIVLCDWFTSQCSSARASMTFLHYSVKASPTTVLLATRGGEVTYIERYEGAMSERDLERVVPTFPQRAEMAERGARVDRPLTEAEVAERLAGLISKGGS